MRINHNITALNTYNKLTSNTAATAKSLEKLSSGLKINKAGDNAAGLAISEKMRGQIRGLDQASTNASDAISLINTAEGALSETHSILQRMRELAVQSANDTNVTVDRDEIQKEMNQLTSEINRIGNTTEFNTQKLLNGDKKVIADTAAKVVGNTKLDSSVAIRATKIYNTATSSGIAYTTATADIGATATGSKVLASGDATALGQNELTLTVGGVQKTVTIASGLTIGSGTLISGLNGALSGAFSGTSKVTASLDGGKLKLTVAGGSAETITINGGGMADLLFGSGSIAYTNGVDSGSKYLSIHTATKAAVTGSGDVHSGIATSGGANELTLTVNGTQKTITVDSGISGSALLDAINSGLAAFGSGADKVTASFTAAGKLELTTANGGSGQTISIDGGNMKELLFGTSGMTTVAGQNANNTLSFKVGGLSGTQTLTIDSNNFTSGGGAAAIAEALQKEINGNSGLSALIQASVVDGKVVLSSKAVGTTITDFGGTAAASLGFTNPTMGAGLNENNSFTLSVDGGTASTITLSGGNYSASGLVTALQSKIDEAFSGKVTVKLESGTGKLAIQTVSAKGTDSTINITGATEFLKAVGFGDVSGANETGEEGKGTSVTFQIGANTAQSMAIQIEDMRSAALKISSSGGGTVTAKNGTVANYVNINKGKSVNDGTDDNGTEYALDVSTYQNATNAISVLDDAIASVSAERSKLGSYQNRLEHTINNLGTSSENLTSAESRIRDVDMAKEMMEFTKNNILSQAAQSMLAQANQQPQSVLQLLQ